MSSSGKITTISSQIDLGAIEPISNSLDFQTIVPNGHSFYAAQRFNQFNFGHHKKWVIDVDKINAHVPFTAHFMYVITKEEKKPVTHSIVSDSEV